MKRLLPVVLAFVFLASGVVCARADDTTVNVAAIMKRCSSGQECITVATSCASSCANTPVNALYTEILARSYSQLCGKASTQAATCATSQPTAECVDGHCMIASDVSPNYSDITAPAAETSAQVPASASAAPPAEQIYKPGPAVHATPVLEGDPAWHGGNAESSVYAAPASDRDGKFTADSMPKDKIRANILKEYGLGK